MTTLDRLGADDLRQVVSGFRDALRAHQDGINRLNVYPVPDGDTGTNMALTMESVVAELDGAAPDLAATCKAIGHGSLMGARGNSGVILSQILRGFTQVLATAEVVDGAAFAEALTAAAKGAYEAVGNPVEGTILTVVREAAEGATAKATETSELAAVADAALAQGQDALARTPQMLQVLADAGVVDSGGTGLLLLLHSALHVIDGRPVPEASVTEAVADAGHVDALTALAQDAHAEGHGEGGIADLRYEVMYLLEAPDAAIPAFKDVWAGIGDSIVVVGGDGLFNCHIHTDDIGASIEAAIEIGKPSKIRVTDLLEEVEEERWVREAEEEPAAALEPVTTAVVAIATGEGIKRIFHSLGVQQVITGGQSMNPSTAQILAAVEAANAQEVVILPNNKNIIAVAEQVDATTTKTVRVVPTRGIPEGFAALIAYDPEAPSAENAAEMAEAAANVVAGEVTMAVRDSTCDVGPIAEGDFLGIGRAGIRAVAPTAADAATVLLAELLTDDHEILTLIEGEGATAADTRRITEWLSEAHPDVSAEVHHGGQPLYPYFLGVE
ncbi:DAK2 domain-containing protein [Aquihabitans sp. G128]|uniref:DAK2 domain-containing protein n=1 Tax=Aquihabitans sp. G128 TaxID=2849779 RepID=UPI001C21EAC3|nr:DAK2 domain-containing protein [Aquihabitans sp. G128]QXC62661.1 DAK2 domain-containing protein [Aquihabitans sp. G128]